MRKLTQQEVDKMILQHEEWLRNGEVGKRPVFSRLDLSDLEFKRANLYHSNFECSDLSGCNFRFTNLEKSEMKGANLKKANLIETNLFRANLYKANLTDVKVNEYTMFYFQLCPEEGSFIGYKKVVVDNGKYAIAKLLIPEDARRNSATTYRCRADKVIVLEIVDQEDNIIDKAWSNRDKDFMYELNNQIEVPEFDEDRWHEAAQGIHFYLSKELAKRF